MPHNFNEMLSLALEAVQSASNLVKKIQQETIVNALNKDDNSPVTIADFSSQAVISKFLQDAFRGCLLVGEEDSDTIRQPQQADTLKKIHAYVNQVFPNTSASEVCDWIDYGNSEIGDHFWTVDPIDGTKGFLRGDQYVVALAYIEHGRVQIGVLGCPNLDTNLSNDIHTEGSLVYAVRGMGAWISPMEDLTAKKRLYVSNTQETSKIRLLRSFESAHTNTDTTDLFMEIIGTSQNPLHMDSQAKYALLAAGQGDMLLRMLSPKRMDYKEKIWDQAAGSIILEEAGGKITDLLGNPLDFTCGRTLLKNTGVLATNGKFHDLALEVLHSINQ